MTRQRTSLRSSRGSLLAAALALLAPFALACPDPVERTPVDAGVPDAGAADAAGPDGGAGDAGPAVDAGEADAGRPDAGSADGGAADGGGQDGGGFEHLYPEWPPVFVSAFGLSYDGPVADEGDVWIELTVARADGLAALGGWSLTAADHGYVNEQLSSAQVPFALADGDVIRVHGNAFGGTADVEKTDNNLAVWDVVAAEGYGPSLKHGLLILKAADGRLLDAVIYQTGINAFDWLEGDALALAQAAVVAGEWPSSDPDGAVLVADADRQWARLLPGLRRAGDAPADWESAGATIETYYEDAAGKTGAELKAALHAIIAGHVVIPYDEANSAFSVTDAAPGDPTKLVDFYTGRLTEADYNKEHVWAKSHGGFSSDAYAGYSDLHHLRPTRPDINSRRWHLDFAEGGVPYSDSGCNIVEGLSFEPRDAVKGDVARTLFYMAVRYEGDDPPMPDLELVEAIPSLLNAQGVPDNYNHVSTPRLGKLSELLLWHAEDPPDDAERARNDVIFEHLQRNRNPFVDHPEWVHEIWGGPEWPQPARALTRPGAGR